jgi:hypothetical protein
MKIFKFRKTYFTIIILTAGYLTIVLSSGFHPIEGNEIAYPEGYRSWTHVKTALVEKGNPAFAHWGGFHHIYANSKAIDGYATGEFADGSVLVFDVLEAAAKDSLVTEGKRKLIDVMVRDTGRFKRTGGWGFEEFAGDSRTERKVGALAVTACYSCHAHQKTNDHVFSSFRN